MSERPIGQPSPQILRVLRSYVRPMVKLLFRPTMKGIENLPASGPFLLVANHSAGAGAAEIACFAHLYESEIGLDRRLNGFAHVFGFKVWLLKSLLRHLGAVPSTYEDAERALAEGVALLIFPGGDHEALRPIWQAGRVDFAGRKGFLKIARRAGVPIVPMGIHGSHYTAPILLRSKTLAWLLVVPRLIGLKRWGISLLGLIGAGLIAMTPFSWPVRAGLIWCWLWSPFVPLPIIPWTIRFRIGAPIPVDELFSGDLDGALARVEGEVQRLVDQSSEAQD